MHGENLGLGYPFVIAVVSSIWVEYMIFCPTAMAKIVRTPEAGHLDLAIDHCPAPGLRRGQDAVELNLR